MRAGRRTAIIAIYTLALIAGLVAAFHPTLLSGFTRLQTDPGDTLLNHYILEHSWLWLTRSDYAGTLWSPPCFYPQPNTLAYSENLLGTAPLYWLLRSFAAPLLAYQLWMLAVTGLTFATAAWMLRRFGATHGLCALGAGLFAFGLPRVAQIGHQQLLPHLFAPLALWAAWRFLEAPRTRMLAALLVAMFLQTLASIYLGWLLGFALVVFAGCTLLADRDALARLAVYARRKWYQVLPAGFAATAFFALLLAPYRDANRGFHRSYREIARNLPTPAAWLTPPRFDALHEPHNPFDPPLEEQWLYNGAVPLGLAALAIAVVVRRRRERDPIVQASHGAGGPPAIHAGGPPAPQKNLILAALATAGILVLVTLRWPGGASAWWLVYCLAPGADAVRAVGRIAMIVYLFALLGGVLALDAVLKARLALAWRHAIVGLLGVVAIAEQVQPDLPHFDPRPFYAQAERIAVRIKGAQCAYVELDPAMNFYEGHLAAMWAGLLANVPVVNGYSGRYPPGYPEWTVAQPPARVAAWLRPTRAAGFEYLPVDRSRHVRREPRSQPVGE
jgi:hypothetical protein